MAIGRDSAGAATCPRCGEESSVGARFCGVCGALLDEQAARTEERKLISVLFVDLVGFTVRADGADPEDVRDALHLYHARVKQRIERYGGIVEKFIGDAVMAVFGAPVAHGDDAERAVRAGLRVLESIDDLNREHALDLAARAAVNTGEAVVTAGGERTGEAMAIGDVVNTASRLQSAAPIGGLIVGEETYRATRQAIRYEAVDPVEAKGKAEPLSAWLAVAPSVAPAERPLATTPLIGRDRELELIQSLWARSVAEARPHLVTLLGPPGIGKSRLCREVSDVIAAGSGRSLHGRCLPYEEQTGYQAFSHLVRNAAGILDSDPPALIHSKLRRTVDRLLPEGEAVDTERYLALLLGLKVADPVDDPRLLYFAARRFIECLGLEQPTILVFEDVHWARSSELSLLEYLAKHVRDAAVLLVATARPEFLDAQPGWGSGLAQTTIPLQALAPKDAASLAGIILGPAAGPSPDVARLVEVAEGNPLFLEELAASVVEFGDAAGIPVTVKEAIASRIDALPADTRSVLLSGAVVGRTFWRGSLRAVARTDELDEALDRLEARDLVRREPTSQLAGDAQFTFKHTLIREVAYGTVPRRARRRLHAAVARYLEDTIEGATEMLAWALARHWREAGEPTRAIPYLLAAADAARRGWAHGAVVDLYTRALELAEDDAMRRHIHLQRGLALVELEDYARAADELGRLLPKLAGQDRFDALIARGHATLWMERHEETLEMAEQAVELAAGLGSEALPAALALQSQAHAMRGEEGDMHRALELGDRALELWPSGARPYDLAEHLHLHADCTYWAGHYGRCTDLSRQARALASDVQSAEALLRGGGTEALALTGLGKHEEAIGIWDELFDLARELERNPRVLLNYSSLAYRELLQLDEARRRNEEALELSSGEAFGMPRRFAHSDLLFTDLLANDVGRAQVSWPVLWEEAETAAGWTRWLIYGRLTMARAEIALRAEGPESAVEWAQRSIEIARRTRRRKYEAQSLSVLGDALARLGRRDESLGQVRAAVAVADELVGAPARWQARAVLGRVAYALGEDNLAAPAYGEAAELVETFVSALAPERAKHLLGAPAITEILSLAGRSARRD